MSNKIKKSVKFGGYVAIVEGSRSAEAVEREPDVRRYADLVVYAVKYGCDVRVKSAVTGRPVGFLRGGKSVGSDN